jgi:hypothetical protein
VINGNAQSTVLIKGAFDGIAKASILVNLSWASDPILLHKAIQRYNPKVSSIKSLLRTPFKASAAQT